APQLQVKCAGTPMAHAGSREARYHGSELRLLEPARDGAAQHTPLGAQFTAEGLPALAGDEEHAPFTPGVCADKKAQQSRVGLPLVKTVQVEQRIDLHLARGDLTSFAAIELGKGRSPARLGCLGADGLWRPRLWRLASTGRRLPYRGLGAPRAR